MRRIIAAILALIALMGLAATYSPAALADGDPASDVLIYDSVFAPYDLHANSTQLAELDALVKYVSGHGYPVKVAMVGSAADLGTVTQLWEIPNKYGTYLGKELSYVYKGTLLVVMPQGYGLFKPVPTQDIPKGDYSVMDSDNLLAPGSNLIAGAYSVVDRLAKANGVTVPARLQVQTPATSGGSGSVIPWIGLAAGLVAVAGAWGVSLRVRPIRRKVLA